jgi:hypothetical protein
VSLGWLSACNLQVLSGFIVLEDVSIDDKQQDAASALKFVQSGPHGIKQGKTSLWDQRANFKSSLKLPVSPAHVHKC